MYCKNCGVQMDASNKFCSSCGAVVEMQAQDRANQFTTPPNNSEYHPSNHEHSPMKSNKNKKTVIIACVAVLLVVGLVAVLLFTPIFNSADQPLTVWDMLDLGEKYLRELEYEQALEQFLEVIEIEPRNPRGYTGAAEAYIGLDREDDAIAILEVGLAVIGESESISGMLRNFDGGGGTGLEPHPTPTSTPELPEPVPTSEPTPQDPINRIYAAYFDVLKAAVEKHGITTSEGIVYPEGVHYAELLDFENVGIPALIFSVGDYDGMGSNVFVYGFSESAILLYEEIQWVGQGHGMTIFIAVDGQGVSYLVEHYGHHHNSGGGVTVNYYTVRNEQWVRVLSLHDEREIYDDDPWYGEWTYYINNIAVNESSFINAPMTELGIVMERELVAPVDRYELASTVYTVLDELQLRR